MRIFHPKSLPPTMYAGLVSRIRLMNIIDRNIFVHICIHKSLLELLPLPHSSYMWIYAWRDRTPLNTCIFSPGPSSFILTRVTLYHRTHSCTSVTDKFHLEITRAHLRRACANSTRFNGILDAKRSCQVGNLRGLTEMLQVCRVLAKGFKVAAKPRRW